MKYDTNSTSEICSITLFLSTGLWITVVCGSLRSAQWWGTEKEEIILAIKWKIMPDNGYMQHASQMVLHSDKSFIKNIPYQINITRQQGILSKTATEPTMMYCVVYVLWSFYSMSVFSTRGDAEPVLMLQQTLNSMNTPGVFQSFVFCLFSV